MASVVVGESKSPEADHAVSPRDRFTGASQHVQDKVDDVTKCEEDTLKESAHQLTQATLEAAARRLETIESQPTKDVMPKQIIPEEKNHTKTDHISHVEDPLEKATRFLEKHQLLMLFQSLTSDIVLKRPSDPLQLMIEEIEKIQEQDRHRKGVFLKVNKQNGSGLNGEKATKDYTKIDQ